MKFNLFYKIVYALYQRNYHCVLLRKDLGMEYYNGSFDIDINNVEGIGKKILEHINKCNYTDFKESDLTIIDNRITWNQIEDNDCNILETIEEEEEADKCYICDYDIFVSINGVDLIEEELREILPEAE